MRRPRSPLALVGRFELRCELIDDLDLALRRHM
jgi:hypothetical protein